MTFSQQSRGGVQSMSVLPWQCCTFTGQQQYLRIVSASVERKEKSDDTTRIKGWDWSMAYRRLWERIDQGMWRWLTCINNNYDHHQAKTISYHPHSPFPSDDAFAMLPIRYYLGADYNYLMSIFKLFKKKQNGGEVQQKLNVTNVFNREQQVKKSQTNKNLEYNSSKQRRENFETLLNSSIVDLEKLKQLSWNGIPQNLRSPSWKILLKYVPTNQDNQLQTLVRKRKEYFVMVNTYIENPSLQQDAQEKKIFKLINDDVLRTLPESNLFRNERIQKIMRRLLYVWHMRHPASGYVQGINDVATPFIVVFLSEYVQLNFDSLDAPAQLQDLTEEQLSAVEGDSYYCLSKILDGILDNYTSSWPGIQKSFVRIEQVVKRVDPQLLAHFSSENIDFYHMYFKWVTCLLLRQFSMKTCLRLFDTYLAIESNYFGFCLYILAAIILKYSKKFKKMGFEEMMIFQQNMPTKEWSQEDLATVIAEAYVYQSYFLK